VLDEGASGVAGAVDLVVFGGEGLEEEGGEGGGGDVLGGEDEDEDVYDFLAGLVALSGNNAERKVPMDHPKSKKYEGVGAFLALHGNLSKKTRIVVFEHFAHQLVIVLIDEFVTVCPRS